MILLNKQDIQKIFNMKEAIETSKEAFRLYSEGRTVVPLRTNIDVPKYEGQTLYMIAYVEDIDCGGVKIVSVFPKNIEKGIASVQACMVLVDEITGETIAMLDGTYLTQLRTGAAQGAATDILARKDAKIGVLFGAGGQATSQLEAMLTVRPLEYVYIFDVNKERAREFAAIQQERLSSYGANIVACDEPSDIIPEADIITTVTTSKKPVFKGSLVKRGAHINGVGAYTPQMQELDEDLIIRADKIYVDSKDAVLSEAGDLIIPINKGLITKDKITGELGEVIIGSVKGREHDDEITIFKTVGIAVQDIVTGYKIYQKALKTGVGVKFEF